MDVHRPTLVAESHAEHASTSLGPTLPGPSEAHTRVSVQESTRAPSTSPEEAALEPHLADVCIALPTTDVYRVTPNVTAPRPYAAALPHSPCDA